MGEVYLTHDTLLDRPVAVKFIADTPSDRARDRFLIEARAIARLQHPNVVAVHRVGEIGRRPYLGSEFLRGAQMSSPSRSTTA
jgi:serine/threonine protein kinase